MKCQGKFSMLGMGVATSGIVGSLVVNVVVFVILNAFRPWIIYSHPNLVMALGLALATSSQILITRLPLYSESIKFFHLPNGIYDLERIMTWELIVFWQIILFITTTLSIFFKLGSFYYVPLNYIAVLLSAVLSLSEPAERTRIRSIAELNQEAEGDEPPLLTERDEAEDREQQRENYADEEEANDAGEEETSSLLGRQRQLHSLKVTAWHAISHWIWLIRFMLQVPIPMIFSLEILIGLTTALHQTLADGSPPIFVWMVCALLSWIPVINIGPFCIRLPLSRIVPMMVVGIVCVLLIPLFLLPTFSVESPLKLYFQQYYNADTGVNRVDVIGAGDWTAHALQRSGVGNYECTPFWRAKGSTNCSSYHSLAPSFKSDFNASVKLDKEYSHKSSFEYDVRIKTGRSRVCDIMWSDGEKFELRGAGDVHFDNAGGDGHIDENIKEVNKLRIWKRDKGEIWARVRVNSEKKKRRSMVVKCLYDEWLDGSVPALDNLMQTLPVWTTLTKYTSGLVQVEKQVHED